MSRIHSLPNVGKFGKFESLAAGEPQATEAKMEQPSDLPRPWRTINASDISTIEKHDMKWGFFLDGQFFAFDHGDMATSSQDPKVRVKITYK